MYFVKVFRPLHQQGGTRNLKSFKALKKFKKIYSELYRKIQDTQMLKDNSKKIKYITENLTNQYVIWQNLKNKIFFQNLKTF